MRQSRHLPFYLALAAGLAAGLSALWVAPLLATVIVANAFFAIYLIATLARFPRLSPEALRRSAAQDDIPVAAIFAVGMEAVVAALAALFIMLNAAHASHGWALALALCAVPLGWMTIHMMAAAHYAHLFWQAGKSEGAARGLAFPDTQEPGGMEFIYFAFVIGMTAQTSDVAVTSRAMRRVNILHAVVSFFFNTVLVAAAVNAAVTLSN